MNELLILNEEISAWKLTREIRDAGKSQGAQLLKMILAIHPCPVSQQFQQTSAKEWRSVPTDYCHRPPSECYKKLL